MDPIKDVKLRISSPEYFATVEKVLRRACLMLLNLLTIAAYGQAQTNPQVDQPMASATFVNIYWDSSWDADNPSLTKETLDLFTQKMVGSTYFQGLSEYGVTSVSFAGGFLPDPHCPQKAPSSVGFYDPFNTSIAGFIQCEHDNGPAQFRQSGVVYNVILPASSVESDFWTANFCTGAGSPVAWHYHGLPPFFSGQPIYTISQANPGCGNLFDSVLHEMVEAMTDPYPIDISIIPPKINIGMTEIADVCEGKDINMFLNSDFVQAPSYWSKKRQRCINFNAKVYLLYDRSAGLIRSFVSPLPLASTPNTLFNQRTTWSHIVGGNFGGHGMGDFLFYDTNAGVAEFFSTDETGQNLTLLQSYSDWSPGHTLIVPGNFGGTSATGETDLLIYDGATGSTGFFDVWGQANINLMRTYQWSTGHTMIVPGNFGGTSATGQSDFLIYDGATGNTAFFDVWGWANINPMRSYQFSLGHTSIVPGNFGGTSATGQSDLLIYDGATGHAVFMDVWGWANLAVMRGYTNWSPDSTIILPGNFGGTSMTGQNDLLIFNAALTSVGFFDVWGIANINPETGFTGLPHEPWSLIAASQP